MTKVVLIPYLNPLRFRPLAGGKFACDLIPSFEEKAIYVQKFCATDKLMFQVLLLKNNWFSMGYEVLNESFEMVAYFTGGLIGSYGDYDVWSPRSTDQIIDSLEPGVYYIQLKPEILVDGVQTYVNHISEKFEIVEDLPESMLIEYSHDGNEFDMAFYPTGLVHSRRFFQLRVEGGVTSEGFNPASKDTFYVDQLRDIVLLSSIPFNVFRFTFGPGAGLPNWMADKINRILSLSYVEINGRQYVKNEGAKLEAIREKGYPLAGWQIELVEAENVSSISIGDAEIIGDYNPDYNQDYF